MSDRIDAQVDFLREADRLKSILRASRLIDNSRHENSAEHSWHVMLYAAVLGEHAGPAVRIDRVLRMLLIHDIVEIDAGDAPIHGHVDHEAMATKEAAAATRLFGLLPQIRAPTIWRCGRNSKRPKARMRSLPKRSTVSRPRLPTWHRAAAHGPITT